jgi:hypothetical protein
MEFNMSIKSLSEIRASQPDNHFSQDAYLYMSENGSNRAIKVKELLNYFNMLNNKTFSPTLSGFETELEIDTSVYKRCVLSGSSDNVNIRLLNISDGDTFELIFNPQNININFSEWTGEEIAACELCVLTIECIVNQIFYSIKYAK